MNLKRILTATKRSNQKEKAAECYQATFYVIPTNVYYKQTISYQVFF